MDIQRRPEAGRGQADRFTGDVWFETLVHADPPSRLRVNAVHFAPAARTAWHSHAVGQTLVITDGVGRVQSRGGDIHDVRPGDTVQTPPGEWHWHGAAPGHVMTHLAIWEAPGSGPESTWGDAVTDAEYLASDERAGSESAGDVPGSPGDEAPPPSRVSSGPWSSWPPSSQS